MHDHSTPILPGEIQTHHDRIPLYGNQHTICAVQSGSWHAVETWDEHRVPADTDAVCIPEGLHVTLADAAAVCLDLVVAGHLDAVPGFDLTLRTLTVLATGHLELRDRGRVTFRDGVIDTTFDPAQFGHGLICVDGAVTIEGQPKTPWATLEEEIEAGYRAILFEAEPLGWQAGDVLVLPDTRQPTTTADTRQTEYVTVASVDGLWVTLTAPVQFDHLGWRNQEGDVDLLPDVGNLSRSIVLQSANPNGTRGHVLLTGRSDVTARYVELRDLGRTKRIPLNSTTRDAAGTVTHIGTNQIGRYAWHFHHCLGPEQPTKPWQFELTDSAVRTSPKWGVAIHNSHYGNVSRNVVDGADGAGIVTETPHEYASLIEDNLIIGPAVWGTERITGRSGRNDPTGDFWHSAVGLGLDSAACTIRRNHIYACKDGIGMAGFATTVFRWPAFRGADPMTDGIDVRRPREDDTRTVPVYPFDFPTDHNQVWGARRGIETWTVNAYPDGLEMFPNLTLVHCRRGTDFEDQDETTTQGWRILGDFSTIAVEDIWGEEYGGLTFKPGYEFGQTHRGIVIRGYRFAYQQILNPFQGRNTHVTFTNATFECPIVLFQPRGIIARSAHGAPCVQRWDGCTFLPVNGQPPAFLYGYYPLSEWTHSLNRSDFGWLAPVSYHLRPWADGRNLDVYLASQAATFTLPAIPADQAYGDMPPGVHTNAELIALGTPIFGAVIPDGAEPFGADYDGVPFFAMDVSVSPPNPCPDPDAALLQQIAQLQQQVTQLQQQVAQLESDLGAAVALADGRLFAMQMAIATLQNISTTGNVQAQLQKARAAIAQALSALQAAP